MTVKDFYEWVVENKVENYSLKVLRNEEKSHLIEIDDDKKQVIFYSK